jgi:hypothetical protein
MDRRTENRLIGALGAVAVAGLIVVIAGLAIAMTRGNSGTAINVAAASPTGYNEEAAKQAIVDSMSAARASAIQFATDHPELLPPRSPGFVPTATPTPVPVPVGVPCTSEQLAGKQFAENAATGGELLPSINIANTSSEACDLPVISSMDGFDTAGNRLFSAVFPPISATCSPHLPFCIAQVPLPLSPSQQPADLYSRDLKPGTAIVGLLYDSRCYTDTQTPACHAVNVARLTFNFAGGVSVDASIGIGAYVPPGYENDPIRLMTVALNGKTSSPVPTIY